MEEAGEPGWMRVQHDYWGSCQMLESLITPIKN